MALTQILKQSSEAHLFNLGYRNADDLSHITSVVCLFAFQNRQRIEADNVIASSQYL